MAGRLITSNLEGAFRALMSGVEPPMGSEYSPAPASSDGSFYAPSVMAHTGNGLVKTAGSGIIYTQP